MISKARMAGETTVLPYPDVVTTDCPICGVKHILNMGGPAFRVYVERFNIKVICSPECQAVFTTQRLLQEATTKELK